MGKHIRNGGIPLLTFSFLSYALPLGCILLMKKTALGQGGSIYLILFGIGAASPTIAAIVTSLVYEKKAGVIRFFQLCFTPKLMAYKLIIPVLVAFVIFLSAKLISCMILKTPFEIAELTSKQFLIIIWAFVAEEMGWRGFLTQRLATSSHRWFVPLWVGLIWAFWHYQFYVIGTIDVAIPLFIVGCIVDSYLYATFFTVLSNNILVAMFFHVASNFFINFFLINPNMNGGSSVPYVCYVLISFCAVIGINGTLKWYKYMKGKNN